MQKRANEKKPAQGTGRHGRSLPAALCGVVGRIILLLVILACLPVPVARMCGYEIYDVVSGSMEPAIPVGSAVFVRSVSPMQLAPQDVIAFQSHGTVITHRVVENNTLESSLITQGDANAQPDPEAVPYANVIGRVERHVSGLGWLLSSYTGGSGRLYLICFAAAGALLSLIPALLPKKQKETQAAPEQGETPESASQQGRPEEEQAPQNAPQHGTPEPEGAPEQEQAPSAGKRGTAGRIRRVLMILLALIFAGSLGGYAFVRRQTQAQRQAYTDLAQQVAAVPDAIHAQDAPDAGTPPITVDFDALKAINSDIVGWIYCEDTAINYPVLYGETNDTYLRHDFEKKYSVAGSIFIDVKNSADFSDVNTIVYGHHMDDGTMFATLENWQDQAFFDAHPVLWLFTPEQTYRIMPFSAYQTNAYSETYSIFSGPCEPLNEYLRMSAAQSVVQTGAVPDNTGRHVLLSTCASAFGGGDGRSVLHGVLEPVA